ncbi:MAG: hypothetical protein M3N14_00215 [Bacteroidota bacterium]|nr:hypothetical protein [Bacteroidota bacterium]
MTSKNYLAVLAGVIIAFAACFVMLRFIFHGSVNISIEESAACAAGSCIGALIMTGRSTKEKS